MFSWSRSGLIEGISPLWARSTQREGFLGNGVTARTVSMTQADRESGSRAASRVLVATVGTSPLPVALSILTLRPDRVILVHSVSTQTQAERIEEVVRSHHPSGIASTTEFTFDRVQITDEEATDFIALHARLGTEESERGQDSLWTKLANGGVERFMLDYTGGTQVMVSALVEFHLRWHSGDAPWLRCYAALGGINSTLALDGPPSAGFATRLPLYDALTLAERARLHGADIRGLRRDKPTEEPLSVILARINVKNSGVKDFQPMCEFRKGFGTYLEYPFGPVGDPFFSTEGRKIGTGTGAEYLTAQLLSNADVQAGRVEEVEVYLGAELHAISGNKERLGEFDLLWRYGNIVVGIEVKLGLGKHVQSNKLASLATRLIYARQFFGGTALTVIVATSGSDDQPYVDAIKSLGDARLLPFGPGSAYSIPPAKIEPPTPQEVAADPARGTGWAARAFGADPDEDDSRNQLAQKLEAFVARYLRDRHHGLDDTPESWWAAGLSATARVAEVAAFGETLATLATGAGGSPLAVELGSLIDGITLFPIGSAMTSSNYARRYGNFPDSSVLRLVLPLGEFDSYTDIRKVIESGPRFNGFYITPATKAGTAAMTVAGMTAEYSRFDLIYADRRTDRIVTRSGRNLAWDERSVDWEAHLDAELGELKSLDTWLASGLGIQFVQLNDDTTQARIQLMKALPASHPDADNGGREAFAVAAEHVLRDLVCGGYSVLVRKGQSDMFPVAFVTGKRKILAILAPFSSERPGKPDAIGAELRALLRLQQLVVSGLFGDASAVALILNQQRIKPQDFAYGAAAIALRHLNADDQAFVWGYSVNNPEGVQPKRVNGSDLSRAQRGSVVEDVKRFLGEPVRVEP